MNSMNSPRFVLLFGYGTDIYDFVIIMVEDRGQGRPAGGPARGTKSFLGVSPSPLSRSGGGGGDKR